MGWYATKKASKLPDMDKNKILVFDVETTGKEPSIDEIIQITILDGYGTTLFSSYIKPVRHKIWTEAQRINGIRYDMVKRAPIMLSIAFKDGFFHAIFLRLLIVLAGIAVISRLSGIIPRDIDSINAIVAYVRNNFRNEPIVLVASIVVALGALTIIIRILQKIILIPKWIIIHIQRLLKTISEFF